MPLAKLQLSAPPAIRYRQYESRLAPFCAGSLEPGARSAMGQEEPFRMRSWLTEKGGKPPFPIGVVIAAPAPIPVVRT